MDVHDLERIEAERRAAGRPYLEFIRVPTLSVGLYVLEAGEDDRQQPHAEDEVYHVLHGRAIIRVGEETRPVGPGSVVFVAARVPHRFEAIGERLEVLVFFAPAEGSAG